MMPNAPDASDFRYSTADWAERERLAIFRERIGRMMVKLDPAPLMKKLAEKGARLALPCINARGQSLTFRSWSPQDRLMLGPLGIPEPSPAAAEVHPDVMLVPLAAFDKLGHRIGYGAGYYDYTFAHLRKAKHVIGVGIAFAAQETKAIPALSHDVPLDYVLTERKTFDFRSS
jgi:5-formyltetrahydrofolate cyclo-ligase